MRAEFSPEDLDTSDFLKDAACQEIEDYVKGQTGESAVP